MFTKLLEIFSVLFDSVFKPSNRFAIVLFNTFTKIKTCTQLDPRINITECRCLFEKVHRLGAILFHTNTVEVAITRRAYGEYFILVGSFGIPLEGGLLIDVSSATIFENISEQSDNDGCATQRV